MEKELKIKLVNFTIDCKRPLELANFYGKLLDWTIVHNSEEFVVLAPKGTNEGEYPSIVFQLNEEYIAPVWPVKQGEQQTMAHLDFAVNELENSVKWAKECGAKIANEQFSEKWTVMIDPEGHPFCLVPMKDIFESNNFALK